jgi:hypothetical protein
MITINKDYEKRIFIGKPVGEDGDLIDREIRKEVSHLQQMFNDGQQMGAAVLAMQLIKSICRHFVEDEHWTYFDDMYSPAFTIDDLFEFFNKAYAEGKMESEVAKYLSDAWKEIEQEESYEQYGVPMKQSLSWINL